MKEELSWVDMYLDKLFAGEAVKIEELFCVQTKAEQFSLNDKEEDEKERVLH